MVVMNESSRTWKYFFDRFFTTSHPHAHETLGGVGTSPKRVEFENLTAMTMKSTVFWGVGPCGPVETPPRLGGSYCLHFQD
jgi:hypothetical protein